MLDHGTGVVVGETAIIQENVYLMHDVTLGATGTSDEHDRHPKIESNVFLGACMTQMHIATPVSCMLRLTVCLFTTRCSCKVLGFGEHHCGPRCDSGCARACEQSGTAVSHSDWSTCCDQAAQATQEEWWPAPHGYGATQAINFCDHGS